MKTFLFTAICSVFFSTSFSQTQFSLDSISNKNTTVREILIRCSATVENSSGPLFIIDGVPADQNDPLFTELDSKDIVSIDILRDSLAFGCYGKLAANGTFIITTTARQSPIDSCKEYPFKVYRIPNENWVATNDVYNAIRAKVPSVSINVSSDLSKTPKISMRGDDNTIVIVDGIRYDASILNTSNPADIEHISVATDVAASNYLRIR